MNKGIIKIISGILILSFIGIKYHPESDEPAFFIKYRPNFKVQYYSPLAESNLNFERLEPSKKQQELKYQEFVGNFLNEKLLDTLSPLIIALMSFLLISGSFTLLVSRKKRNRSSWKRMLTAYLSNLMIFFLMYSIYFNFQLNGLVTIVVYFILCTILETLIYNRSFYKKYKKMTSRTNHNHRHP